MTIYLLFGNICSECNSGEVLFKLRNNKDSIIVVPCDFKDTEIRALKRTFGLKGNIILANKTSLSLMRRIRTCKRITGGLINIMLELSASGKLNKLSLF